MNLTERDVVMIKEHVKVNVKTKFGALEFVFTSRLIAIKFAMDESRKEEVLSFSVEYISQYETTSAGDASNILQYRIDMGLDDDDGYARAHGHR